MLVKYKKKSKDKNVKYDVLFQGLKISVESPKGSVRKWHDPHNNEDGETKMLFDYGYFQKTTSLGDDEEIDVYVGPDEDAEIVYVVNQMSAPEFTEFDEQKCFVGFNSEKEAKEAYLAHYNNPKFFGSIHEMTVEQFKNEFVSKALPAVNNVPSFTYDCDDLRNVDHWLNSVGTLKDKDLIGLSQEVWGAGYNHVKVSQDHVRAELRGWLHDQYELLMTQPQLPQVGDSSLPAPEQLPHTT